MACHEIGQAIANFSSKVRLRTSFLSLSGAIVADIDLGSESLRFLGGLRFPATWSYPDLISTYFVAMELT